MMDARDEQALARALDAVDQGLPLDEALGRLPSAEPELVDAVRLAYRMQQLTPVTSGAARERSLARMLEHGTALHGEARAVNGDERKVGPVGGAAAKRAANLSPKDGRSPSPFSRIWEALADFGRTSNSPRLALAMPVLVVLLIFSTAGAGLRAQSALPGEGLYPVKRGIESGRLALATGTARAELEAQFESARRDEVKTLLTAGRDAEEVSFVGQVSFAALPQLVVDGFDVAASPTCQQEMSVALGEGLEAMNHTLIGHRVRVNAMIAGGQLVAQDVELLDVPAHKP